MFVCLCVYVYTYSTSVVPQLWIYTGTLGIFSQTPTSVCACTTNNLIILINPRRAYARVTVLGLCVCVCLSVCLSATTLPASVSVYACNQLYPRVSLRLFFDFGLWIFFLSKVLA